MAELELPRRPGPVAATVAGYDFRDKPAVIELYRIDQSTPSPATATQLAAARRRGDQPDKYLCTECGAHPELPVTVYQDGPRLCRACAHIRALRILQRDGAGRRAHTARRAAELLAGPLAVLHIELTERGTTPSGSRRPPSAARLAAVDGDGSELIDVTVRLVGPRSAGIPAGAVAPADAALPLRQALAGRRLLYWPGTGLSDLVIALRGAGWSDVVPQGYDVQRNLEEMTRLWRDEVDPRTLRPRVLVPPGRADRMLYLLRRIAADAPQDGGEA
jgi:hypothetical protein